MYKYLLPVFMLTWCSCAVRQAPTGGPEDTRPPRLDSSRYSTPNFKTNFKEKEIILTFDEWVKLNNPAGQILVSPLMLEAPKVAVRHKSVVVTFKEPLKENITYTVKFGDAVQDITKGNVSKGLQQVFSTGPKIDSLRMGGNVSTADGSELPEGALLMLYDKTSTAAFRETTPLYIAKIDKSGRFDLENLRADTFRVVALADINLNYRYDLPNEKIAFADSLLYLAPGATDIRMRLFEAAQPLALLSAKESGFHQVVLRFNTTPVTRPEVQTQPQDLGEYRHWDAETLTLWFSKEVDSAQILLPGMDTQTVQLQPWDENKPPKLSVPEARVEAGAAPRKGVKTAVANTKKVALPTIQVGRDEPVAIALNHPIVGFNTRFLNWTVDSVPADLPANYGFDSLGRFVIKTTWRGKVKYKINFLPGAFTDIFGATSDSLVQEVIGLEADDLGTAIAKVSGMDSIHTYRVSFLSDKKVPIQTFQLPLASTAEWKLEGLKPGNYLFSVLRDDNNNGRWDTGDYDLQRQPEPLIFSTPVAVKPKWEAIMEIGLSGGRKKIEKR